MEKEILKLKVQNLAGLRTSTINILIVLIGGMVSLMFLPNSPLKYFLACIGGFYIIIFVSNLVNITNKIDTLLINRKDT